MPIYAYRCAECGHTKDVLQKISDAALVDCPACGAAALRKQITAAGFQLKGSGWYATDFRNGGAAAKSASADGAKADAGGTATSSDAKPSDGGAQPAAAAAAAPAAGCGGSCACH